MRWKFCKYNDACECECVFICSSHWYSRLLLLSMVIAIILIPIALISIVVGLWLFDDVIFKFGVCSGAIDFVMLGLIATLIKYKSPVCKYRKLCLSNLYLNDF